MCFNRTSELPNRTLKRLTNSNFARRTFRQKVRTELAGEVGREIILRSAIGDMACEFDVVILDCPSSLGRLTLNALTTTAEVFLLLRPDFLALHGLSKLLKTIELVVRRLNPTLVLMEQPGRGLATAVATANPFKHHPADSKTTKGCTSSRFTKPS